MRPARVLYLLASLAITALVPAVAAATPHHAHFHYMIGIRAYAGSKNAAMLYQEATAGDLDLRLALINATEMERLANEIAPWVDRVAATPADEAALIADEIVAFRERDTSALKRATELRSWIEPTVAKAGGESTEAVPCSAELSTKIAQRAQEIFYDFAMILRSHKSAETKLEIPIPPDPPVPAGGPVPAK